MEGVGYILMLWVGRLHKRGLLPSLRSISVTRQKPPDLDRELLERARASFVQASATLAADLEPAHSAKDHR